MSTEFAITLVEDINAHVNAVAVLDAIGFHSEKVQHAGDTLKAFCPIHKDSRFRSLLVDSERHAFRCTIKTCPGYSGGSFIELYALAKELSLLSAAIELAEQMGLEMDPNWKDHLVESYLNDARSARDRGDLTEAESLLRELISVSPDLPEARVILASIQAEMGDPQAAAEEYSKIVEYYLSAQRLDDAEALVNDAIQRFPDNEDLLFMRVKVAEGRGDNDLAIERMEKIVEIREGTNRHLDNIGLLEQLVEKAPTRTDLPIKLAGLYEQQHNVRGASRQYDNAAKSYLAAGLTEKGIELLEKVIQFNGENIRARLDLARHLADFGNIDKARDHTFRAVNQQIDQQEFGFAVSTVNSWLEREPDNIDARELLARVLLDQERGTEAAVYLAEGAKIAASTGLHERAADLLLRAKFLLPADASLRRRLILEFQAMDQDQRAAFEMIDLAEILYSSDQANDASALLLDGISKDISLPLKLQMVASLANHNAADIALDQLRLLYASAEETARPEERVDIYELMVRLSPTELENHRRYVQLLYQLSPAQGAEAAADSIQSLLNNGQVDAAVEILEFIAGSLSEYGQAAPRLIMQGEQVSRTDLVGLIYQNVIQGFAEEDAESALKAARRMAVLDPSHPSAPSDIAFLLSSLGRSAEAAEQYSSVATTLRASGDFETALQFARESVTLNPDSVQALAIQAMLAVELLTPDEAAPLTDELLRATRAETDPALAATGYLAYADLYPDDDAFIKDAIESLEILDAAEGVAQLRARQAGRLSMQGDWKSAGEVLKLAAASAPQIPQISEQYGEVCKITGASDAAAKAYAEAATAYSLQGDTESAVRCTNSAQVAGPTSAASWEALFHASEATGLVPVAQAAAEELTSLFAASGPPQTAVRWAKERTRVAPDSAEAHEALGAALFAIDQPENAALAFSAAAAAYLKAGDAKHSLATLQQVVSKNLFTAADQDTLLAILSGQEKKSDVHAQASRLLGVTFAQTGNFDAARKLAADLSDHAAKAGLYLTIAAAEQDPEKATEAYVQSARASKSAGATEESITTLQSAVALGVAPFEVHRLLAILLTEAKRYTEAFPHQIQLVHKFTADKSPQLAALLKHLRKIHGADVNALIELATALLSEARPDLALTDLEAAATIAGADNNASALIAICGLDENLTRQSGVLTSARADALMGMENEQQALTWVADSGRNLLESGKAAEALEMARRWTSLAGTNPEAHRLLADANIELGKSADAINALLEVSRLLQQSRQFNAALEVLDQILDMSPALLAALRHKVEVQKALEQPEHAAVTLADIGDTFAASDDSVGAMAAYRESLTLHPDNPDVLWTLAELVHKIEGSPAALPLYRQWANQRRDSVDENQWIADLIRLVETIPASTALLRDLTDAQMKTERPMEALPYLKQLSNLLEAEGDYQGAAQTLEAAIAHESAADPLEHLIIADLYRKGNSPARAQDHLRHAGRILQDSGKPADAAQVFDDLLKLAGDSALPEDYSIAAAAHSKAGNSDSAVKLIDIALSELDKHSGNKSRREALLAQAIEIAPLNADYVVRHMDMLPPARAMTRGLKSARARTAACHSDDAISVLTQVIALAPHDMSLRQELFEPLRLTGNRNRLRQELMTLASDALASGDTDAAIEAMDEAAGLVSTAQQYRLLAELNERSRRLDQATAQFMTAALLFSEDGKSEQAIANVNRAISAKPSAIPAESIATLVRRLGDDVYDVAREQLRSALTARRQKQSQIIALALLDTTTPARGLEIFKTIHTLGGSTFLVGIAHQRVKSLADQNKLSEALDIATTLLDIAPDSADTWYLAAQVFRQSEMLSDARRSALEAARLFSMSGAVSEEEDCYLEALAAEPDNLYVKATLADYFVREKRQEEAVALLQEVIVSAEQMNNTDLLLEALNRVVQLAPGNTDLREKLATRLESIAPDSAIDNWLQTAELFQQAEHHERVRRIYAHVLTLQPGNETALQALLNDARDNGDLEAMGKLTGKLADVKASRRNVGEACRLLQSYLQLDPDNLEILEQLASLSGKSNDVEVFTTTTRALATKFQKLGDHTSALRQYERLLERSPRDTALLSKLLDCCAGAGNSEKGLLYARQLLAVARETEDPERIRLAAVTILNYDNSDAAAHNDLGESLLSLNRVSEAVAEWMRAAELYEGAGETAYAFTCYRRVTQISPGTVQAWRHLGELAISIGDMETARMSVFHVMDKATSTEAQRVAPLLAKLVQALPEDRHVHQTALEFYRKTENHDKGAEEYIWLADHENKAGNSELAESLLAEGTNWVPSNQQLKQAHYDMIRQMGRLEELQLRLRREAEEHEKQGRQEEAISVLYELVDLAPGQIALHRDLARSLNNAHRPEEAIEQHLHIVRILLERAELEEARDQAEALVEQYPENIPCRERIADMLAASSYPDLAARYYRAAADAALGAKDTERRIELLNKAVKFRPAWAEARKTLAQACEEAGMQQEAFDAWLGLIPSLLDSGEFSEATATLDRLSRQQPDSPEVREQLAELYEKTGNRDQQADVLRELVDIYEKANRDLEGLEAYRKLASIVPDDPAILTRYVELLSQVESPEKNMPQEYGKLADALERRGDFEGALQTYEQILGMAPDNTAARSRYATFLLSRGSRNRALSEMRTLANLYMDRHEPSAAVEVLNAALTISPRDADLCLALAASQEAAGMHEDARVSYSRATAILASTAAVKGIDTYRRILTQDENNTAVRQRLVELLLNSGDTMEAARQARILAEVHLNRGEMLEAENAYRIVDQCEPETVDDVRDAIRRDSYDPSLQYVHYVRLGNRQFDAGDIDNALDSFRTARSLHDDQPELIQKCIDCISLIAPEAEAIPDYLLMAEKLLLSGEMLRARLAYEQVRLIDPFNNDARGGLESVNAAENINSKANKPTEDDHVLKASRSVNKRVALMDLLVACREAALDPSDSKKLGQ